MATKSRFYPEEFGWGELSEQCAKCRQPLHVANGQEVPFCPNCAIDRKNAYNGRAMLALAKARDLQDRLNRGEWTSQDLEAGRPYDAFELAVLI